MKKKFLRSLYCMALMFLSVGALCFASSVSKSSKTNEFSAGEEVVSTSAKNTDENIDGAGENDSILSDENNMLNQVSRDTTLGKEVKNGQDFYQITSAGDLAFVSYQILTGSTEYAGRNYILTQNILSEDFDGKLWTAIGTPQNPYKGMFYGQGYSISGIKTADVSSPKEGSKVYAGLFGVTEGATIAGLTMADYTHVSKHTPITSGQQNEFCGSLLAYGKDTLVVDCYDGRSELAGNACKTIGHLTAGGVYRGGKDGTLKTQDEVEATVVVEDIANNPANGFAVKFNLNGGNICKWDGSTGSENSIYYATLNESFVAVDAGSILTGDVIPGLRTDVMKTESGFYALREGFKVTWKNGTGATGAADFTELDESSLTSAGLYATAVWTAKNIPVVVDYNYDVDYYNQIGGGTDKARITTYSAPYDASFKNAAALWNKMRIGYSFNGFYDAKTSGERLDESTTIYIGDEKAGFSSTNESYNLYANWSVGENHNLSITFAGAEGERADVVSKALNSGSSISITGAQIADSWQGGNITGHTPNAKITLTIPLAYGYSFFVYAPRNSSTIGATSRTSPEVSSNITYTETGESYSNSNSAYNDPYTLVKTEVRNIGTGNTYTITIDNLVAAADFTIVISRVEFAVELKNAGENVVLSGETDTYTACQLIEDDKRILYTRVGEAFTLEASSTNQYFMMNPTLSAISLESLKYKGEGNLIDKKYASSLTFQTQTGGISFTKENVANEGAYIDMHIASLAIKARLTDPEYRDGYKISGANDSSMKVYKNLSGQEDSVGSSSAGGSAYEAGLGEYTINGETAFGFVLGYDTTDVYYTLDRNKMNELLGKLSYKLKIVSVDISTGHILVTSNQTDEEGNIVYPTLGDTYDVQFAFKPQEYDINVKYYLDNSPISGSDLAIYLESATIEKTNVYAKTVQEISATLTKAGERFLVYEKTEFVTKGAGDSYITDTIDNGSIIVDAEQNVKKYQASVTVKANGFVNDAQIVNVYFTTKTVEFKFTEDANTPMGGYLDGYGEDAFGKLIENALMPTGTTNGSITAHVADGELVLNSQITGVNIISGYYFFNWYLSNGAIISNDDYSLDKALSMDYVLDLVEKEGSTSVTIPVCAGIKAKTVSITFDGTGDVNGLVARHSGDIYEFEDESLLKVTQTYSREDEVQTIDFSDRDFVKIASIFDHWEANLTDTLVSQKSGNESFSQDELVTIWGEGSAITYTGATGINYYVDKKDNGNITFVPKFSARNLKVQIKSSQGSEVGDLGVISIKLGESVNLTAESASNSANFFSSINAEAKVDAKVIAGRHAISFEFAGKDIAKTQIVEVDTSTKLASFSLTEANIKEFLNSKFYWADAPEGEYEFSVYALTEGNEYTIKIVGQSVQDGSETIYPERISAGEVVQDTHEYSIKLKYQDDLGAILNGTLDGYEKVTITRSGYILKALVDRTNTDAVYATFTDGNWEKSIFLNAGNLELIAVWEVNPDDSFFTVDLEEFQKIYNGESQIVATASISARDVDGNVFVGNKVFANGERIFSASWDANTATASSNGGNLQFVNVNDKTTTYTYTVTIRDALTGKDHTLTIQTKDAQITPNKIAISEVELESYFSGSNTFYGVKGKDVFGEVQYVLGSKANTAVDGVTGVSIVMGGIYVSENKYSVTYSFNLSKGIAENFDNISGDGSYTITVPNAVKVVKTPILITAKGEGLYIANDVLHTPMFDYKVDASKTNLTIDEIKNNITLTFVGELVTNSGEIGIYKSTGEKTFTWVDGWKIQGEDDALLSSNLDVNFDEEGQFEIVEVNETNAYIFEFNVLNANAENNKIVVKQNLTNTLSINHLELKVGDEVLTDALTGFSGSGLYTYRHNGHAVLTIRGNGTGNLIIKVRRNVESNNYSVSLNVNATNGSGNYKFNGFYDAMNVASNATVDASDEITAGVQAGTAKEAGLLSSSFTDNTKKSLVYSNVKPLSIKGFGEGSVPVYVSVGSSFTQASPAFTGFTFTGFESLPTGVMATSNLGNTTYAVDSTADLAPVTLVSTWEIAKPDVDTVLDTTLNRDANISGFVLDKEMIISAINGTAITDLASVGNLEFTFAWFKQGTTAAIASGDSATFDGTMSCDGNYYIVVTASRSGMTSVESDPIPFTIKMSAIKVSMSQEDISKKYSNADYASTKVTVQTEKAVAGTSSSEEVSIASHLSTRDKNFYFTITKNSLPATEIKTIGTYTITLNADENYFEVTSRSFEFEVTVDDTYTIQPSDVNLSKEYGESDPELTVTLTRNGEQVKVMLDRENKGEEVGAYQLSYLSCDNENYSFKVAEGVNFVITKSQKTLEVLIDNIAGFTKVYNNKNTILVFEKVLNTGVVNGWELVAYNVNSDGSKGSEIYRRKVTLQAKIGEENAIALDATAIKAALTGVTLVLSENNKNVNAEGYEASIVVDGDSASYAKVKFVNPVKFIVTPFTAELTDDFTKTYGEEDNLSKEYTLVEDEIITVTFDRVNKSENVGTYPLTVNNTNSNYILTTSANLVIEKAGKLTIQVGSGDTFVKTYNNKSTTLNLVQNGNSYSLVATDEKGLSLAKDVTLLLNGSVISQIAFANATKGVILTLPQNNKNANSVGYIISVSIEDGNYNEVEIISAPKFVVEKDTLQITMTEAGKARLSKAFGSPDPEEYSITYTQNDEEIVVKFDRAAGEEVGTYPLTVNQATKDLYTNYTFVDSEDAVFTIRPSGKLVITVNTPSKFTKTYNALGSYIKQIEIKDETDVVIGYELGLYDADDNLIAKSAISLEAFLEDNTSTGEISGSALANAFSGFKFVLADSSDEIALGKDAGTYKVVVMLDEGKQNYGAIEFNKEFNVIVNKLAYSYTQNFTKEFGEEDNLTFTDSSVEGTGEELVLKFVRAEEGENANATGYALKFSDETINTYKNYQLSTTSKLIISQGSKLTISVDNPEVFKKFYNGKEVVLEFVKNINEGVVTYTLTAKEVDGSKISGATSNLTLSINDSELSAIAFENALRGATFTFDETCKNAKSYTMKVALTNGNYALVEFADTYSFEIKAIEKTISLDDLQAQNIFKYYGFADPAELVFKYAPVSGEEARVALARTDIGTENAENVGMHEINILDYAVYKNNVEAVDEKANYNFTLGSDAAFEIKNSTNILRIILDNPDVLTKAYNSLNTAIKAELKTIDGTQKWTLNAYDKDGETLTAIENASSTFTISVIDAADAENPEANGDELTFEDESTRFRFEHAFDGVDFYFADAENKNFGDYRIMRKVTGSTYSDVRFGAERYFHVTKAQLTVTSVKKEYDGTLTASSLNNTADYKQIEFTGFVAGEDDGLIITANFADPNVGENKTVSLTLSGRNAGNYTLQSQTFTTAIIEKSKAKVEVSYDGTATSRIYGTFKGNATMAEIVGILGSPVAMVNNENMLGSLISVLDIKFKNPRVSKSGYLAAGEQTIVVTFTSNTFAEVTGVDGSAKEYSFKIIIDQQVLDFSEISLDKEYDGTTLLPNNVDFKLSEQANFKHGDDVVVSVEGGFDRAGLGGQTTSSTIIILSGDDADNYKVSETGHPQGEIIATELVIKADPSLNNIFVNDGNNYNLERSEFRISYPLSESASSILSSFKLPTRTGYTARNWQYLAEDGTRINITSTNLEEVLALAFEYNKAHSEDESNQYFTFLVEWKLNNVNVSLTGINYFESITPKVTYLDIDGRTKELANAEFTGNVLAVPYYSTILVKVDAIVGYKFAGASVDNTISPNAVESIVVDEEKLNKRSGGEFTINNVKLDATINLVSSLVKVNITVDENQDGHKFASIISNTWGEFQKTFNYIDLTDELVDTLPTLTLTKGTYYLSNWTYSLNGSDELVLNAQTISSLFDSPEEDIEITFKANWTGEKYIVKFLASEGVMTGGDDRELKFGDVIGELPTVDIAGKTVIWKANRNDTIDYTSTTQIQSYAYAVQVGDHYELTLNAIYSNNESTLTASISDGIGEGEKIAQILDNNTPVVNGSTWKVDIEKELRLRVTMSDGWDYEVSIISGNANITKVANPDNTNLSEIVITKVTENTTFEINVVAKSNDLVINLSNASITSVDGKTFSGNKVSALTGTQVVIKFAPNSGYKFDNTSLTYDALTGTASEVVVSENEIIFTWKGFTGNDTINVSGIAKKNKLTLNDPNGYIASVTFNEQPLNNEGYATGSMVTIKMLLRYGYMNAVLTSDNAGVQIKKSAEVQNSDHVYEAIFTVGGFTTDFELNLGASPRPYTVQARSDNTERGEVNPTQSVMFNFGESETFTATAKNQFVFAGWFLNDKLVSSDAVYEMTITESLRNNLEASMDNGIVILIAKFSYAEKDISISVSENGSVVYSIEVGEQVTLEANTNITLEKVKFNNTLVISLKPDNYHEVNYVKFYDVSNNEIVGKDWFDKETNTITMKVDISAASKIEIVYKPCTAIVDVDAVLKINNQTTTGSNLGGKIVLVNGNTGKPIEDLSEFYSITEKDVSYRVNSLAGKNLYFKVYANKGFELVETPTASGCNVNIRLLSDNSIVYEVENVHDGVQVRATFTATSNLINVQFVDENSKSQVDAGKIIVGSTNSSVVANGDYSSDVNIYIITGAPTLTFTANTGFSFELVTKTDEDNKVIPDFDFLDESGKDFANGTISVEYLKNNNENKFSTGFNETIKITLSNITASGTLKIKVKPIEYTVQFKERHTDEPLCVLPNKVTYGGDIIIPDEISHILKDRYKDENRLLGYYSLEQGQGVQYVDGNGNVAKDDNGNLRKWDDNGYRWNSSAYVKSQNYDEATRTFTLYAAYMFMKDNITINFVPSDDGKYNGPLSEINPDLNVNDLFVDLDTDSTWYSPENPFYISVKTGKTLTLNHAEFAGYTFHGWKGVRINLDGTSETLNIVDGRPFEAGSGDTTITAIYYANFELKVNDVEGGRSYLIQEGHDSVAGSYDTTKPITLVAIAYAGYDFKGWYDDAGNLVIAEDAEGVIYNQASKTYTYQIPELRNTPLYLTANFVGDKVGAIFDLSLLGEGEEAKGEIVSVTIVDGGEVSKPYTQEFEVKVGQTINAEVVMNYGYTLSWSGKAVFETNHVESLGEGKTRYLASFKVVASALDDWTIGAHENIVKMIPTPVENEVVYTFEVKVLNSANSDKEVSQAGTITYTAPGKQPLPINSQTKPITVKYGAKIELDYKVLANYMLAYELDANTIVFTINGEPHDLTLRALSTYENKIKLLSSFLDEYKAEGEVKVTITFRRMYWVDLTSSTFKGDGTNTNPYLIESASDLALLATLIRDGEVNERGEKYANLNYEVTSALDFAGRFWTPIGEDAEHAFNGTIHFRNYKVTNVTHDPDAKYENPDPRFSGLFWHCGQNARILQSNPELVLALSIVGGVLGLLLIILIIILVLKRRRKKRMEELANG